VAAIAERNQDKILIRTRDAGWRPEHVLAVGADLGAHGPAERGLRDRAAKGAAEVGLAVEPDENVADDVLPQRQPPVAGAAVCRELDWHRQASLSHPAKPHVGADPARPKAS